jgi:hypothetical protein
MNNKLSNLYNMAPNCSLEHDRTKTLGKPTSLAAGILLTDIMNSIGVLKKTARSVRENNDEISLSTHNLSSLSSIDDGYSSFSKLISSSVKSVLLNVKSNKLNKTFSFITESETAENTIKNILKMI